MDYLTKDNSVNTLKNKFIIRKSQTKKTLFEILTNQKAFNESMINENDLIKTNMNKLNIIHSNDLNNLVNSNKKEKNLVLI